MDPLEVGMDGCELDGDGDAEAGNLSDWQRRSWLWRQGCKVWNLRGEPFGFIGAMGARKLTTRLDLHACHDLPQCLTVGRAHSISIHSLKKLDGRFASLDRPRLVTSKYGSKSASMAQLGLGVRRSAHRHVRQPLQAPLG